MCLRTKASASSLALSSSLGWASDCGSAWRSATGVPTSAGLRGRSAVASARATSRCTVLRLTCTPASASAKRMPSNEYPRRRRRSISVEYRSALRDSRPGGRLGLSMSLVSTAGAFPDLVRCCFETASSSLHQCYETVSVPVRVSHLFSGRTALVLQLRRYCTGACRDGHDGPA